MVHFPLSLRLLCAAGLLLPLTACMGTTPPAKEPLTISEANCPDWTYAHMANYRNSVMSNYGCAHATNLNKMVMDPNDLIAGTGDTRPDATRASGVIEVYREPPEQPASTGGESITQGQ